jgi:hypothetical protein
MTSRNWELRAEAAQVTVSDRFVIAVLRLMTSQHASILFQFVGVNAESVGCGNIELFWKNILTVRRVVMLKYWSVANK